MTIASGHIASAPSSPSWPGSGRRRRLHRSSRAKENCGHPASSHDLLPRPPCGTESRSPGPRRELELGRLQGSGFTAPSSRLRPSGVSEWRTPRPSQGVGSRPREVPQHWCLSGRACTGWACALTANGQQLRGSAAAGQRRRNHHARQPCHPGRLPLAGQRARIRLDGQLMHVMTQNGVLWRTMPARSRQARESRISSCSANPVTSR